MSKIFIVSTPLAPSWEIFGVQGGPLEGVPKSWGRGAEDFDKLCNNLMGKFSKLSKHSIQFFLPIIVAFIKTLVVVSMYLYKM